MDLLNGFSGPSSRVRCFLHIINLVAQKILRQFDVPKKKSKDDPETDLDKLAGDIEKEEIETREELEGGEDDDDDGIWDFEDDEVANEDVRLVRKVLVKVRGAMSHYYILITI